MDKNPYAAPDSTATPSQPHAASVRWYERKTLWVLLGIIAALWFFSDFIIEKIRIWAIGFQNEYL